MKTKYQEYLDLSIALDRLVLFHIINSTQHNELHKKLDDTYGLKFPRSFPKSTDE